MKMALALLMIGFLIVLFLVGLIVGLIVTLNRRESTNPVSSVENFPIGNSPIGDSSVGNALVAESLVGNSLVGNTLVGSLAAPVIENQEEERNPDATPVEVISNGIILSSPNEDFIQDESGIALPMPGPSVTIGTIPI